MPKFLILGCDKTTPLKEKRTWNVRTKFELIRDVPFIGAF
jgi:hypothetical protein